MTCARCGKYPANGKHYSAKNGSENILVCWDCLYWQEKKDYQERRVEEIIDFKYRQFFALENRIAELEKKVESDTKYLPQLHFHKEKYPVVERLHFNKGTLEVLKQWRDDINTQLNKMKGE